MDCSPLPAKTAPAPASGPFPAYLQPRPRAPRSPAQSSQVRISNRRREYLERNPAYFDSMEHELAGTYVSVVASHKSEVANVLTLRADPLLYDALIRRFQSYADREKEGRKKGYSRVLEVDLLRGEAKLTRARAANSRDDSHNGTDMQPSHDTDGDGDDENDGAVGFQEHIGGAVETPTVADIGDRLAPPETLDEGRQRWRDFLRRRFVLGRDEDFNYRAVDENDDLDALERRDADEAWFDDEEPGWASDQPGTDGPDDTVMEGTKTKAPEGETGIQDF